MEPGLDRKRASAFRTHVRTSLILLFVGTLTGWGHSSSLFAADETPNEVLAAQIRKQGHECKAPIIAEKDLKRSKPHGAVWKVSCGDISYELRLVPNMAADIERISQ